MRKLRFITKIIALILIQAFLLVECNCWAGVSNINYADENNNLSNLSPKIQLETSLVKNALLLIWQKNNLISGRADQITQDDIAFDNFFVQLELKGVPSNYITSLFLFMRLKEQPEGRGQAFSGAASDIAFLINGLEKEKVNSGYIEFILGVISSAKDFRSTAANLAKATPNLALFINALEHRGIDEDFIQLILENILFRDDLKERAEALHLLLNVLTAETEKSQDDIVSILRIVSGLDDFKKITAGLIEIIYKLPSLENIRQKVELDFKKAKQKKKFLKSIFAVHDLKNGKGKGSTFVIGETPDAYLFLTNAHVVANKSEVLLKTNDYIPKILARAEVILRNKNEKVLTNDVAVLKVYKRQLGGRKLVPFKIATGFYDRQLATLVSGYNGIVPTGHLVYTKNMVILAGAMNLVGDSGSPIVIKQGNTYVVIGINTAAGPAGIIIDKKLRTELIKALSSGKQAENSGFVVFENFKKGDLINFLEEVAAEVELQVQGEDIKEVLGSKGRIYRLKGAPVSEELKERILATIKRRKTIKARIQAVQKLLIAQIEQKALYNVLDEFIGHYETERDLVSFVIKISKDLHPDQKQVLNEVINPVLFKIKVQRAIEEQRKTKVDLNERGLWFYDRCLKNLRRLERFRRLSIMHVFEGFLGKVLKSKKKSLPVVWVDLACGKAQHLTQAKRKKKYGEKLVIYGVDIVNWHSYDQKNLSTAITGDTQMRNYTFLQRDIQNVQLPEKADLITMVYALPYLDDPIGTLINAYNQLNPGGILVANMATGGEKRMRIMNSRYHPLTDLILELKELGIQAYLLDDVIFIEKNKPQNLELNLEVAEVITIELTGMKGVIYSLKDEDAPLLTLVNDHEQALKFLQNKKIGPKKKIERIIQLSKRKIEDYVFLEKIKKFATTVEHDLLRSVLAMFLSRNNPSFWLSKEYRNMNKEKFLNLLKQKSIKTGKQMKRFAELLNELVEEKVKFIQENTRAWSYPYVCMDLSGHIMEKLLEESFSVYFMHAFYPEDSGFFGFHSFLIVKLDQEEFILDFSATQFHKITHHIFKETGIVIIPLRDLEKNPQLKVIYNLAEAKRINFIPPAYNKKIHDEEILILKKVMGNLKFTFEDLSSAGRLIREAVSELSPPADNQQTKKSGSESKKLSPAYVSQKTKAGTKKSVTLPKEDSSSDVTVLEEVEKQPVDERKLLDIIESEDSLSLREEKNGKFLQIVYPENVSNEEKLSYLAGVLKVLFDDDFNQAFSFARKIGNFRSDGLRIELKTVLYIISSSSPDLRVETKRGWVYIDNLLIATGLQSSKPFPQQVLIESAV